MTEGNSATAQLAGACLDAIDRVRDDHGPAESEFRHPDIGADRPWPILRGVYYNDALAREQELSPEDRLRFHQKHSRPLLKQLHEWMEAQLAERQTEPNSGLGKAISYLRNHWPKLTLFLEQPGAPLDNNVVERALKKAILNRKNALFYKTLNGARVGDLFLSLIHTCELNGANPFDYLTQLQRHAEVLSSNPSMWMPWNYRDTLAGLTAAA